MKIEHLKINHLTNPLGFDLAYPTISYVVTEAAGKRQASAQVQVSLKYYFSEFARYGVGCRFGEDCVHVEEPGCGVKEAVREGKISQSRYDNYRLLYQELKGKRRY